MEKNLNPNNPDDYFMEAHEEKPKPEQPPEEPKKSRKEKRYDVSLQTEKDPTCYKDFYYCDTLTEAKEKADKEGSKVGRRVMVYDRKEIAIVHRYIPPPPPPEVKDEEKKPEKKQKIKRKFL